jgi:hypothetical protein
MHVRLNLYDVHSFHIMLSAYECVICQGSLVFLFLNRMGNINFVTNKRPQIPVWSWLVWRF